MTLGAGCAASLTNPLINMVCFVETCACTADARDYRGNVSVTESGRTCQAWDAQSPHSHSRTADNYPGFGLEGGHNHCRNPDGEPWAWCYTTDPNKRWDFCSRAVIPACDGET